MKQHDTGDLFTVNDIKTIVEIQCCLDKLPWTLQKYYLLKAGYFALRNVTLGVIIALGIVSLGILSFVSGQYLIMAILLLVVGVLIGFIIAWEIDSRKDDSNED